MKTTEAHQIANPKILPKLKDLEEGVHTEWNMSFLIGIVKAQEKEIEVLDSLDVSEMRPHLHSILATRLEALKISCEDLRRVLK